MIHWLIIKLINESIDWLLSQINNSLINWLIINWLVIQLIAASGVPGGSAAAAVAASGVPGGAAPRRSSRNSAPRAVAGHGVRTTRPASSRGAVRTRRRGRQAPRKGGGGGLKIVGLPPPQFGVIIRGGCTGALSRRARGWINQLSIH